VLQEAYDYGMLNIDLCAAVDYVPYEDEDETDYREQFPPGLGGTGAWWNELGDDAPEPVRWWTKVNENVVSNAEYHAAYLCFESWRRKHIEKFDMEDRLQESINNIAEQQARWARYALKQKRSAPDYTPYDVYEETVDEEACFELPDHEIPKKHFVGSTTRNINMRKKIIKWYRKQEIPYGYVLNMRQIARNEERRDLLVRERPPPPEETRLPTGTWRDNNNSVNKIAPQKRLALSYAHIAATDRRGALPNHTEDGRLRREGFLGSTEERLKVEVGVAESMEQKRKARFQAQVVAADKKH
jgi:hypothetical protein